MCFCFLHLLFFATVPSLRVEATGGEDTSKSYLLNTRCVAQLICLLLVLHQSRNWLETRVSPLSSSFSSNWDSSELGSPSAGTEPPSYSQSHRTSSDFLRAVMNKSIQLSEERQIRKPRWRFWRCKISISIWVDWKNFVSKSAPSHWMEIFSTLLAFQSIRCWIFIQHSSFSFKRLDQSVTFLM